MESSLITTTKGVSGISRPFKSIVEQLGLVEEDIIMYVGLPGVCTPFIELLSYAIRKLEIKQVYVANLDLTLAKTVVPVANIGIQFGDPTKVEKAKVIVILGGLAMPISPVGREEVSSFLQRVLLPGGTVIGVSFMNMFEQVGWTSALPLDFCIDAVIDPVKTERFSR